MDKWEASGEFPFAKECWLVQIIICSSRKNTNYVCNNVSICYAFVWHSNANVYRSHANANALKIERLYLNVHSKAIFICMRIIQLLPTAVLWRHSSRQFGIHNQPPSHTTYVGMKRYHRSLYRSFRHLIRSDCIYNRNTERKTLVGRLDPAVCKQPRLDVYGIVISVICTHGSVNINYDCLESEYFRKGKTIIMVRAYTKYLCYYAMRLRCCQLWKVFWYMPILTVVIFDISLFDHLIGVHFWKELIQ